MMYNFAEEFSPNPGFRFKKLSEFSGEEFRDDVLEKYFERDEEIIINVDHVESALGASFLSEAFGNIAVKYGIEKFHQIVKIDTSTQKGAITNEEMNARVKEALERQTR